MKQNNSEEVPSRQGSLMSQIHNHQGFQKNGRDLCERLFDSVIVDLEDNIKKYKSNLLDKISFIEGIESLKKNLLALLDGGEIKNIIDRANLIMLDNIAKDL